MKKYLAQFTTVIVSSLVVVGIVSAATTISTNINTGGTLNVAGTSTMSTSTFSGSAGIGTTTSPFIFTVSGTNPTNVWVDSSGAQNYTQQLENMTITNSVLPTLFPAAVYTNHFISTRVNFPIDISTTTTRSLHVDIFDTSDSTSAEGTMVGAFIRSTHSGSGLANSTGLSVTASNLSASTSPVNTGAVTGASISAIGNTASLPTSITGLSAFATNDVTGGVVTNLTGVGSTLIQGANAIQASTTNAIAFNASLSMQTQQANNKITNAYFFKGTYSGNNTSQAGMTNLYGVALTGSNFVQALTNRYGFYVDTTFASNGGSTPTVPTGDNFAFYSASTQANNYFGGPTGIGSTSPVSLLAVHSFSGAVGTSPIFTIASSTTGYLATTTLFTVLGNGNVGMGTTTAVANAQVSNIANATTTFEVGAGGRTTGSCLKLYRTDGTAIYAYVAAGATTFTLSTTACASVAGF